MQHALSRYLVRARRRDFLLALLLAVTTILAYRPAWHGGFIWDDDAYITNNELLTAPDGLRRIWFSLDSPSQYFPLVYTMFRFEHAWWGLSPAGYHVVNILLHIANALLLWRLLVRLRVPGAWLAGAIFALHPVQVESVAWITERKNVLMGFFFLLTIRAWIEFVDEQTKRRWFFYGLALVLYALALFSKTTACTLPAALFLILWLQHRRIDQRRVVELVPFVVLALGMGLLTVWWERYHQGTHGPLFALSPLERLLIASRAIWFYLGKLFWPANLTFIYPRWHITPSRPLDYAPLLGLLASCAAIFFTRRYFERALEVAMLFFVATLGPVLGFIMLYTFRYTFVADHYQYLASIGPIALMCAGAATLARSYNQARQLIFGLLVCVIVTLTALTWRQSAMYADIESLWRTTIARNPDCWMAHNNLGTVLLQKGQVDDAIARYQQTLQLAPESGDADYNLGNAFLQKGEIDAALSHYQKAVSVIPKDPDIQVGLGNALWQKGKADEAIDHYRKALELRPYYFGAHYNLSTVLLQKGEIDEAILHARIALTIRADLAPVHTNLGVAFLARGEIAEGIKQLEKTLEIAPRSVPALNNLAWIFATYSDPAFRNDAKALELAQEANEFSGGSNPVILRTLAAAHANTGQFSRAIEVGQLALSLADRQSRLANALQQDIAGYQAGLPHRENVKR
jgi:tetratricopeptide (TPR) repeat protein